MKASEVIAQSASNSGMDPQAALQEINKEIQNPDTKIVQSNDSVLLVSKIQPGVADVALFTVEAGQKLIASVASLLQKVKSSGIQTIFGDAENTELISALQQSGVQLSQSPDPSYGWVATI